MGKRLRSGIKRPFCSEKWYSVQNEEAKKGLSQTFEATLFVENGPLNLFLDLLKRSNQVLKCCPSSTEKSLISSKKRLFVQNEEKKVQNEEEKSASVLRASVSFFVGFRMRKKKSSLC
ncbi:hypothetical protein DVG78_18905 [Runella aurantiaca]|uniref:Uncharacterized protein n=1 Tax=Runella aurantiaca TaxID=2282308 RepID=A0A369I5E8_9BACT|nr:hypothetical protein DVG78_18905 [Runella aurantiaca]